MQGSSRSSPPFLDAPGAQLLRAWWHLGQALKRHVTPMLEREHGVAFKDFVALSAIEGGANYPRLMCDRLAMPPSGISRMIDDLVKRELVERHLDPSDSRRVRLDITARGEAVLHAANSTMLGLLERGLDDLPTEQVELLASTLRQLGESLSRASAAEATETAPPPGLRAVSSESE